MRVHLPSIFILLTVCLPLLGADLHAQVAITSLVSGDRIRIDTAPGRTISGQVIRVDEDSIAFSTPGAPEVLLPVSQLQGLRVATPETLGALRGAVGGVLAGALIGGFLGTVLLTGGDEGIHGGSAFAFGAFWVSIPGSLVGALIGTNQTVTKWVDVSLPAEPPTSGPDVSSFLGVQ